MKHTVTILDPLVLFGEGGALASSGAEIRTPSFFFPQSQVPPEMLAVQNIIK